MNEHVSMLDTLLVRSTPDILTCLFIIRVDIRDLFSWMGAALLNLELDYTCCYLNIKLFENIVGHELMFLSFKSSHDHDLAHPYS